MTDETELTTELATNLPSKYDDDAFSKMASTGFLPRLQLMTSNSEACKSGEFPTNHYAQVNDSQNLDLGKSVDCLILSWRPKALDMNGEDIVASFDPESDSYADIQKRSEEPNSGCMWGPEFLVYIPQTKAFATFFMGSKSARRVAPAVKGLMYKAATLDSKKVETTKFTWFVPDVTPCQSPFDAPDMDEIKEQVEKFQNPPEPAVEVAGDDDGEDGSDRAV